MSEPLRSRIAHRLPTRVHGPVKAAYHRFVDWALARAGRSRVGADLFYVGSDVFGREMRSVAAGRRANEYVAGQPAGVDYTLRRGIHRLEKGLLSRPRRPSFASGYIEETVAHFGRAVNAEGGGIQPGSETAWAHDVLTEYFGLVRGDPAIERARERFNSIAVASIGTEVNGGPLVPYVRDTSSPSPVSYDELKALSIRRRSVRWYTDETVPRSKIDAAMEVAAQAPSACNRQPFEFRVYDDPAQVQRVASIPGGTAGFVHNIPVVVAVIGRLDAFFAEYDRHVIYIDGSLAAMSFMLALETLGLSSCAINTPAIDSMDAGFAEVLGLAEFERPVMLIAVGYPDPTGMVARSQKQAIDRLRRYNP